MAVKIRERPSIVRSFVASVPSECHGTAAASRPDSGRQMLKMRLMAENERVRRERGGERGNFAPLIDASAKSEKFSFAFPPFLSLSLSLCPFLSIRSFNQASRDSPPPFSLSGFALLSLETRSSSTSKCKCLFCSLPRSCALLLVLLLSIVLGRHTACFRVCLSLA